MNRLLAELKWKAEDVNYGMALVFKKIRETKGK